MAALRCVYNRHLKAIVYILVVMVYIHAFTLFNTKQLMYVGIMMLCYVKFVIRTVSYRIAPDYCTLYRHLLVVVMVILDLI